MNTVPVSFGWKSQWNGYDPVLGKDSATELAPGWIAPVVGGPLDPVALCTTLASVFRHTTDCARQVVTLTGVTAAAELQLTKMGEELTVSCADPALPAMVAWMATGPPGLTPRATPFVPTVATAVLALFQVGAGAPATRLPRASRGVAANCWVVQKGIDAVGGSTDTLATACWTVTASPGAGLATWLDVARATTWAEPFAIAVTSPAELTVAIAGASLVQPNDAPTTGLPPESKAVATSWTVSPRLASEAEAPPADVLTATLVTTCATEMETDPLTPFEDALTAELPFPSVVTSPAVETPATPGELLDQAKVTWLVTSPRGFEAVAESWTVWPTLAKAATLAGAIVIVST